MIGGRSGLLLFLTLVSGLFPKQTFGWNPHPLTSQSYLCRGFALFVSTRAATYPPLSGQKICDMLRHYDAAFNGQLQSKYSSQDR